MSRYLYTILIIILVLTGVVVPSEKVFADSCWNPSTEKPIPTAKTQEDCEKDGGKWVVTDPKTGQATTGSGTENPGVFANAMYKVVARVANIILSIAALLTTLSGYLLNGVVYHTIVNVSENYNKLKPIEEAWRVIRDISNMAFIFVLLYAGIRTIFGVGEDNQKVVKNVVLAAILINFSMFFTRVVIDISNVFALTFYDAIAPGVAARGFELGQAGLSNAFSQYLSYQTLYQMAGNIDLNGIITTAIMGTIMLIIVSFVFFAIAIMFIIRYVVLLLVIILSPIYFISLALPKGTGIGAYSQQWLNALIGQAFFAPIYFLMTWVAVRVMGGIMTALQVPGATGAEATGSALSGLSIGGTLSSGAFMMFINFAIVITLIITALMVAKDWANKVGGGFNKVTSWATGKAGSLTIGTAGRFGRATLGRAGQVMSESRYLKDRVEDGGITGYGARLALARSKKIAGASFDVRATGVGGMWDAGKAQKGGYAQDLKDRKKAAKEFADSLGLTDKEKAAYKNAKENLGDDPENKKQFTDPSVERQYQVDKARREATAKKLREEAENRKKALESRKATGFVSPQDEFRTRQEIKELESRAGSEEKRVASRKDYLDHILGVDKDETKKRADKARTEANETETKKKEEAEATKTAAKTRLENEKKEKEEVVNNKEKEVEKNVSEIENDIKKREKEIELEAEARAGKPKPGAVIVSDEMRYQRNEELEKARDSLKTAKLNLANIKSESEVARKSIKEEHDARVKAIEETHKQNLNLIEAEKKAAHEAAEKLKPIKNIGGYRKDAYVRQVKSETIATRAAREIDRVADYTNDSAPGRTLSSFARFVSDSMTHQSRGIVSELEKEKKDVKTLVEEALKESGEKPEEKPGTEGAGGAAGGGGSADKPKA